MSRTTHHTPLKHRKTSWWSRGSGGPWTAHTLTDLRYSYADLSKALRTGRRPTPSRRMRTFASYEYPRAAGTPIRGQREHESRARAALRLFATRARKELRTSPTTAEDLDHPPTRHRHTCIWQG
ncbi:hypothetical protein J7I98_01030 [Streptomyces sp. ISL-98]|uniref:hypothetical protein n=1 Tax=Streptomyces sp. ISL-98 TaxID=2819192 RepID=UPI001BE80A14|nr:hypothetical protein [Streptomyces sp. ISL-98]MBT2504497.1 hypothetical protein [Streptomyces sp. ISL-98]